MDLGRFREAIAGFEESLRGQSGQSSFGSFAWGMLLSARRVSESRRASGESRDLRSRTRGTVTSRRGVREAGAPREERAGTPGLLAADEGSAESPTLK